MNKSVKFTLKEKETIFYFFMFLEKKGRHASHIKIAFHSKTLQIKYTAKPTKKNAKNP